MSDPAPTHSDDAADELVPDPQVARDAAQTGTGRWKNRRSGKVNGMFDLRIFLIGRTASAPRNPAIQQE
jgi:hypothetical protein